MRGQEWSTETTKDKEEGGHETEAVEGAGDGRGLDGRGRSLDSTRRLELDGSGRRCVGGVLVSRLADQSRGMGMCWGWGGQELWRRR